MILVTSMCKLDNSNWNVIDVIFNYLQSIDSFIDIRLREACASIIISKG